MALESFKQHCRELLAAGVKPTATEFAKRGWRGVTVANDRTYGQNPTPVAVPGSGTAFTSGRYTLARAEVLTEAGWEFKKVTPGGKPRKHWIHGEILTSPVYRWVPPAGWPPDNS